MMGSGGTERVTRGENKQSEKKLALCAYGNKIYWFHARLSYWTDFEITKTELNDRCIG